MSVFRDLRSRLQTAPPPRTDTFQTLAKPAEGRKRRVKSGRTEQLNLRVKPGFKVRIEKLAETAGDTLGAFIERLLALYETSTGKPQKTPPPGEKAAGRTQSLNLWASREVLTAIVEVAAERGLTVSALLEDMLTREVQRLDPHGGKFGVDVRP